MVLVPDVDGLLGRGPRVAARDEDGARGGGVGVEEEVEAVAGLDVGVAGDARLDDVHVGQLELGQFPREVGELRDGVGHAHALEGAPGREADAGAVRADGVDDGLGDLEGEARTLLDAAAPGVGAVVAGVLDELVDEVAVGGVDLDAVEAGRDGVPGRLRVVADEGPDLVLGQLARLRGGVRVDGHGAAGDEVVGSLFFQDAGVGGAAQRPQLQVGEGALGVDGVDDGPPLGDLLGRVDAGDVAVAAGARGDEGALGDDEGAGHGGALLVVVPHDGQRDVRVVGAEARHGRHGDALRQLHAPDLEGGEEFGHDSPSTG